MLPNDPKLGKNIIPTCVYIEHVELRKIFNLFTFFVKFTFGGQVVLNGRTWSTHLSCQGRNAIENERAFWFFARGSKFISNLHLGAKSC